MGNLFATGPLLASFTFSSLGLSQEDAKPCYKSPKDEVIVVDFRRFGQDFWGDPDEWLTTKKCLDLPWKGLGKRGSDWRKFVRHHTKCVGSQLSYRSEPWASSSCSTGER